MVYDIRTQEAAGKTLECLTGVPAIVWDTERVRNAARIDFTEADKDIEKIISRYGGHYPSLDDIDLVVTHVTTSANACQSILEHGIIELKKAYRLRIRVCF